MENVSSLFDPNKEKTRDNGRDSLLVVWKSSMFRMDNVMSKINTPNKIIRIPFRLIINKIINSMHAISAWEIVKLDDAR